MGILENIRKHVAEKPGPVYKRWQDELRALKLADIKKRAPGFYEASGGDKMKLKGWNDKSTNGLTKALLDYLTLKGFYATRINVQGQPRITKIPKYSLLSGQIEHTEKVNYTKSTTKKGTPDINSIVMGIPLLIEVKCGKDRMRDEQREQQRDITRAGGVYYIAKDMESFLYWFKREFGNLK